MKITNFVTPPEYIDFLAKNLFGNCGEIINGSIAYLEPNGGGPVQLHTHEHDHLFIVVRGEAKVLFENSTHIIRENESFLVKGSLLHSTIVFVSRSISVSYKLNGRKVMT